MARRLSSTRRRAAWALLVAAVLLAHALATTWVADSMAGWGERSTLPERLSAVFVREVAPAPVVAAAPPAAPAPKPRRKARARPAAPAASQSAPEAQPIVAEPEAAPAVADSAANADADADAARPPASAEAPASAAWAPVLDALPPMAGASAPSAPEWPEQWPASTRLSYTLTGWFRGEVHGEATVEWLRAGSRYQVHLDVSVGPSFAPYIERHMSSDGELTLDGLAPRRYDERTRIGFNAPRQVTIRFEPDAVILPNGRRRERWAGVQDAASQFVHLSWLFTTQPYRLAPGNRIEIPLALPRSIERWAYDVLPAEDLQTPFGPLPVLHLKPQRITRPLGGDMVVEAWFAPTLLYLPVRIRIHQDEQTWVDMLIDRPPLQAAPGN